MPFVDALDPLVRPASQRDEAGAHVGAPLGVVRLGGEERLRDRAQPLLVGPVERFDRQPEPPRVAAHFVEREQPDIAVERGVLDPLGHDRAGRLLEAGHELGGRRLLQEELPAQRLGEPGGEGAVEVVDGAGDGIDVRAIHGQRARAFADRRAVVESPQPVDFGGERRRRLLELRFVRDLGERTRLARERGERGFGTPGPRRRPWRRSGTRTPWCLPPARRGAARRSRGSSRPRRARRRRRAAIAGSAPVRQDRRCGRPAPRRPGPRRPARTPWRGWRRTPPGPRRARRRGRRCRRTAGGRPSRDRGRRTAPRRSRQNTFSSTAAMWFGTTSRMTPSPDCANARSSDSPPSASDTRVGSTTS